MYEKHTHTNSGKDDSKHRETRGGKRDEAFSGILSFYFAVQAEHILSIARETKNMGIIGEEMMRESWEQNATRFFEFWGLLGKNSKSGNRFVVGLVICSSGIGGKERGRWGDEPGT